MKKPTRRNVRVLIVEDHPMMRKGIRSTLEEEKGIEIIGETDSGEQAVEIATSRSPDVVIMDIGLPGMNGIEATRQIHARAPDMKIIALTVKADTEAIKEMLQAGASGFLSKDSFCQDLMDAIRKVTQGQRALSHDVLNMLVDEIAKPVQGYAAPATSSARLTKKQREVLGHIRESRTTKEIAGIMGVSVKTVAQHRVRIMKRLGVSNFTELVKFALSNEL